MSTVVPFNPPHPATPAEYARRYAEIGWHVLPLWWVREDGQCACGNPKCEHQGKHPLGILARRGQDSATTDATVIGRWWRQYPKANIGISLHASGLCAVDVDPRNGGDITLEQVEAKYGKLLSDVEAITGGGGRHIVFSAPAGLQSLPGKLGPGIDLKLNGYIAVEPSNHVSGNTYEWEGSSSPLDGCAPAPLPDWLRGLAPAEVRARTGEAFFRAADGSVIDDLREALAFVDADDYHQWTHTGMALCELGRAGFDLWDEYSQRSPKYDYRACVVKWKSYRPGDGLHYESVFAWAQEAGWINAGRPIPQEADIDLGDAEPARPSPLPAHAPKRPTIESPPEELLSPPGLLGDVCAWINSTARKHQPALALANAIAALGAVVGRKIESETELRTNFYTIGVSESGTGKEHSRKAIKKLFEAAGLFHLLQEEIGSDSGLEDRLYNHASTLFQIDEISHKLTAMRGKNASAYLAKIPALLMTLFGSANVSHPCKTLSGSEPRVLIQPNCCIYGTSVPGDFFSSLSSAEVGNGFLGRCLIFAGNEDPRTQKTRMGAPPPELVERLVWAYRIATEHPEAGADIKQPKPVLITKTPCAQALFDELESRQNKHRLASQSSEEKSLWARVWEHADKLALLAGALHNGNVDERIAQWAIDLAWHCTSTMAQAAADYIADTQAEDYIKRASRVLRQHGRMTCSQFTIKTQFMKMNERREVLATLVQMGHIAQTPGTGKGADKQPSFLEWIGEKS
jgi:hypothetical protein